MKEGKGKKEKTKTSENGSVYLSKTIFQRAVSGAVNTVIDRVKE